MLVIAVDIVPKPTDASSATPASACRKCLKGRRRLPGGLQRVNTMSMAIWDRGPVCCVCGGGGVGERSARGKDEQQHQRSVRWPLSF